MDSSLNPTFQFLLHEILRSQQICHHSISTCLSTVRTIAASLPSPSFIPNHPPTAIHAYSNHLDTNHLPWGSHTSFIQQPQSSFAQHIPPHKQPKSNSITTPPLPPPCNPQFDDSRCAEEEGADSESLYLSHMEEFILSPDPIEVPPVSEGDNENDEEGTDVTDAFSLPLLPPPDSVALATTMPSSAETVVNTVSPPPPKAILPPPNLCSLLCAGAPPPPSPLFAGEHRHIVNRVVAVKHPDGSFNLGDDSVFVFDPGGTNVHCFFPPPSPPSTTSTSTSTLTIFRGFVFDPGGTLVHRKSPLNLVSAITAPTPSTPCSRSSQFTSSFFRRRLRVPHRDT